MSRSYKHTNISGITTSKSEKQEKRKFNRRFRHIADRKLKNEMEDYIEPDKNEIDDIWSFSKDGKWRFDPKKYPKGMRK
jgi:hypothetical protein